MTNKIVGWLLKLPAILLLIAAFIGGVYAAAKHIQGINYWTPVIILVIVILYFVGEYLVNKKGYPY